MKTTSFQLYHIITSYLETVIHDHMERGLHFGSSVANDHMKFEFKTNDSLDAMYNRLDVKYQMVKGAYCWILSQQLIGATFAVLKTYDKIIIHQNDEVEYVQCDAEIGGVDRGFMVSLAKHLKHYNDLMSDFDGDVIDIIPISLDKEENNGDSEKSVQDTTEG
jgi:hypothetical protein